MSDLRIVEVGPRDGLQNIKQSIDLGVKKTLVLDLLRAGLREIEIGAFVSPKWVPQMANSAELIESLDFNEGFSALVPNAKGMEGFHRSGLKRASFFTAVSDTFNLRNTNKTFAQSLETLDSLLSKSKKFYKRVYLSTVFHCPFTGEISLSDLNESFKRLSTLDFDDLSLGDTIGKATPEHVKRVLRLVENYWPLEKISMHFHDTYGTALANCQTSLEIGVRSFDSSVSGLGGCPYAPGASGNLSTEDLVYLAHREGYSTGVDLKKLISAGAKIDAYLNRRTSSRVHQAVSQNRC